MAAVVVGGPRDDVQPRVELRKCFWSIEGKNNLQDLVVFSRGYHSARPVQPVVSSLRAIFKVKNDATYLREDNPRKEHDAAIRPKKKEGSDRAHRVTETQSAHNKEVLNLPRKFFPSSRLSLRRPRPHRHPRVRRRLRQGTLALDELAVKWVRQKRELATLEMGVLSTAESRAEEKECKLHGGGGDLSSNVLMDLGAPGAVPHDLRRGCATWPKRARRRRSERTRTRNTS
ncbi:hypothetical protein BKA62DRAFT_835530 [Auriculariales sp. MPI-PUGE-AT-0066]|nr:hypothetical protein BKA62DRAFT_835530 [Auriculariales sp. MPI-PUGE-AT-0066]